jgi:hypothetical protein
MPATLLAVTGVDTLVVGAGVVVVVLPPEPDVVVPLSNAPATARTPTTAPTETAPAMKDMIRLMAGHSSERGLSVPQLAFMRR